MGTKVLMTDFVQIMEEINYLYPDFSMKENELLSKHTSFRIGGPCRLMLFPNSEAQLCGAVKVLKKYNERPLLLGGGTNVLAPDEGIAGVAIVTKERMKSIRRVGTNEIEAQCGASLASLAHFACEQGLSGLEFAQGIPGTVGGGLYMNAGAYGGELANVSKKTSFMTADGEVCTVEGEAQQFGYRTSLFQSLDAVILSGVFTLPYGDPNTISEKMKELAQKRREKQPLEYPSAGSAFKRPVGFFAGALIEQAGLKGYAVGGAQISEKHAGFIINTGGATASDVKCLIAKVQERVFQSFGVELEPEIRLL